MRKRESGIVVWLLVTDLLPVSGESFSTLDLLYSRPWPLSLIMYHVFPAASGIFDV